MSESDSESRELYIYVRARTPHGESGCVDVVLSRTQYMYHSTALCRDGVVVAHVVGVSVLIDIVMPLPTP